MTNAQEKTTKTINDIIITLANKDLEAYKKEEKSFELFNWLKDELILQEINNKHTIVVNAKALARIINILSAIREKNLNSLSITMDDKETCKVKFSFDLTTLSNGERRRINSLYGTSLEEMTEDEEDLTYDHFC